MNSWSEQEIALEAAMPMIRSCLAKGQSVTFRPKGTSMLPMLRQGMDSITLSSAPERLKKYDLPLYQRTDGSFVLHRVVAVGQTYTCIGDNQTVLEHGIAPGQIIGVVTEFTRGNKRWTVDQRAYRAYCRFWHYTRPVRRGYRGLKGILHRLWKG